MSDRDELREKLVEAIEQAMGQAWTDSNEYAQLPTVAADHLLPIVEQHYAEERKRSYGLAAAFGYDLAKSEMEPPPGWTERVEHGPLDINANPRVRRVWSEPWRETE